MSNMSKKEKTFADYLKEIEEMEKENQIISTPSKQETTKIDPNDLVDSEKFIEEHNRASKRQRALDRKAERQAIKEAKIKEQARLEAVKEYRGQGKAGKLKPGTKKFQAMMKRTKSGPYSIPVNMADEINIHPPSSPAAKYIARQQLKSRLLRSAAEGVGKVSKLGKRAAVPLAIAEQALSSSDLNTGESEQLKQIEAEKRKEQFFKEKADGDPEILDLIKKQEQDTLNRRIHPVELLDVEPKEEIPEPIGPAFRELASEPEEEDLNYADYLKRKKQQLGYK
jgi:hypothetical protein